MVNPVPFVAAALFLIMIFFDVRKKAIPSILGTATLFVLAVVNLGHLPYALIMFIFAWFLYESELYGGIADVKMITAVGFLINSMFGIYAFVIVLTLYTAIYNVLMRMGLKIEGDYAGTIPIFLSYLIVWLNGGVS
jgi:hypothetical protein